ncbi:MAG: protein-disulfide reductase DsbD, partial [Thiolinea sp.]
MIWGCYPPQVHYYQASLPPANISEALTLQEMEAADAASYQNASTLTAALSPTSSPSPAAPVLPRQDQLAAQLASGSTWLTLLTFAGLGVLLSVTPCMLPMAPILSGIIVGQRDLTTYRAFLLSLTYVLAMALTYTLAGVLAGLFGGNLQALFQAPWLLVSFSLLFVLLALSMFGCYDLQIPLSLQNRLDRISRSQKGGSWLGVAIMGVLSALIVGPCMAAPLAGALIYIGQTGDAVLGGMALFALSIGMGIPLLILGASAGKLMPRVGPWMITVKRFFGVLLLGVAIWMLERVLPEAAIMLLWAMLLVTCSLYLGVFGFLSERRPSSLPPVVAQLGRALGILLLVHGIALTVGAAAGSKDVFFPLQGVFTGGRVQAEQSLGFRQVSGLAELQQVLDERRGTPVMLDFY